MNRTLSALFLLLVPVLWSWSQAVELPSAFVDTEPMGARIVLDGTLLVDTTPALLRGLKPGKHTVAVWKDGYSTVTKPLETAEGSVPVIEADLPTTAVVLAFPAASRLADPQGDLDTPGRQFRFPDGTYSLGGRDGTQQARPVFRDEGLLTLAGWGLTLVSSAALASTASDLWHVKTAWMDHPSTLTVALWASALFELPWYLSVQGRKDRFVRESVPQVSPVPERLDLAQTLFDRGEDALQAGELDKAVALFAQVTRDNPESRLVPGAWFRLARIHSVTGKVELALGEYRLVAETFPQAAYHDRARKALADLYEAAGDPSHALEQLEHMVLTDGFFDPSDIEVQKVRLLAAPEVSPAP